MIFLLLDVMNKQQVFLNINLFNLFSLQIAVVLIDGALEKPMRALKEARRANVKGIEVEKKTLW